jgi:hypothetical protein
MKSLFNLVYAVEVYLDAKALGVIYAFGYC